MPTSVVYDDALFEPCLAHLKECKTWSIGIVLGQVTTKKTFVFSLVSTPAEGNPRCLLKDTAGITQQLKKIDVAFSLDHARQVQRFLGGGMDVIGVFVMVPYGLDYAPSVRALQIALAKLAPNSSMLSLYVCPQTFSVTCTSLETRDIQAKSVAATWKMEPFAAQFVIINTAYQVDIAAGSASTPATAANIAQNAMQTLRSAIENGLILINNIVASSADRAIPKGVTLTGAVVEGACSQGQAGAFQSRGSLTLRGCIQSYAFVHAKATMGEAAEFIKSDVIRTIETRVALMCEGYADNASVQVAINGSLPRRVTWLLSRHAPFLFSDYVFDAEDNVEFSDLKAHASEVLGIAPDTPSLSCKEEFAPAKASSKANSDNSLAASTPSNPVVSAKTDNTKREESKLPSNAVLGAIVLAALAVVLVLLLR